MAAETVARLYIDMDGDDALRRLLANGTFPPSRGDLTPDEMALVQAAAREELPDVVGFEASDDHLELPGRSAAIEHIGTNLTSPEARAEWQDFFEQHQLDRIAPNQ
jgi:hypothetical protein